MLFSTRCTKLIYYNIMVIRQLFVAMSDFPWVCIYNQIQVAMPCTGELGGSILEASGRVTENPHWARWYVPQEYMSVEIICDKVIQVSACRSRFFRLCKYCWIWFYETYRQISNICGTLVGYSISNHSDVVGASPVSIAPTTSSYST